jgi:hypothetical protein
MSPLAQVYYELAEEKDAVTLGSGRVWLVEQRDLALGAEQVDQGSSLVQEAFEGHSSTWTVGRSSEDRLVALQEALRAYDGNAVKFTVPTFTCLPH